MPGQNLSTYSFPQLDGAPVAGRTPAEALAAAHAEAEQIREQARVEGEAAGHADGLARAQEQVRDALTAAAGAERAIAQTREELVEKLSRQAGELALQIAQRIVVSAFESQPERVVDVARAALRRLADRHHVTVLVNPDDLELIEQATAGIKAELGGIEHLDVQADRRVQRGGVIAQTAYGEIDASVSAQFESARALVMAALDGDEHGL
jgi:flagellar assembly protein FliH